MNTNLRILAQKFTYMSFDHLEPDKMNLMRLIFFFLLTKHCKPSRIKKRVSIRSFF